jgi:hypothetical protein
LSVGTFALLRARFVSWSYSISSAGQRLTARCSTSADVGLSHNYSTLNKLGGQMGRPRVADLALARAADPAEIGVLRAYKLLFHNISYANGGM